MSGEKIISLLITVIVILSGLCGCNSDFNNAREMLEANKQMKQESKPKVSDFEVSNVEIDFAGSSSYSNYLNVVGTVKNNSNKEASSITLTIYLYQNGSVILTDKEYIFDLGPYDENSFDFLIDKAKLLSCEEYVVKITSVL